MFKQWFHFLSIITAKSFLQVWIQETGNSHRVLNPENMRDEGAIRDPIHEFSPKKRHFLLRKCGVVYSSSNQRLYLITNKRNTYLMDRPLILKWSCKSETTEPYHMPMASTISEHLQTAFSQHHNMDFQIFRI